MSSEVKNEGLEVFCYFTDIPLCSHSEALAGYAVRDARIAELEQNLSLANAAYESAEAEHSNACAELATCRDQVTGLECDVTRLRNKNATFGAVWDELAALKAQNPVAWMLKNEKGRIEEILPYMPCASDMQPYWPEPFQLYAAPVAKQVVMPEREWLQSDGLIYSLENDVNYYEINVTQVEGNRHDGKRAEFASKLIELLNAAKQGGQDE